jgi:hypothetical protein
MQWRAQSAKVQSRGELQFRAQGSPTDIPLTNKI